MQNFSLSLVTVALICTLMVPVCAGANESSSEWFMKGLDLYNQDKIDESLQAYNRALELDPNDYEAWNNKGIDEGLLGKYDDALVSFNNAVAINESYAEAWYNMGVIYDFKEYYGSAVQAYKRATQLNPSYQKALVRRNADTDIVMARSLSCACSDPIISV
ncbi:MAG: tetratricopeptide repeat protein [Methanothrix sp.]|nr:tetratricopeptide repeat protein [Methanothrix sp.]MDD4448561.1 tetratricopeptide repeat protein [Methanothrix sp.]